MKSSTPLLLALICALVSSVSAAEKPTLGVIVQDGVHKNWYYSAGIEAAQDIFSRIPDKDARFRVIDLGKFDTQLREAREKVRGSLTVPNARLIGPIVGARFLLACEVSSFTQSETALAGTLTLTLIDTSTGEIVWADEVKRRFDPRQLGKAFTGSDEELGALIAWLRVAVRDSADKLNQAPLNLNE
jgi:hypothetical protein